MRLLTEPRSGMTISHLFSSSCPPTISRFVITIIVNPLNRVTIWARSHIGKEICKFTPAVTYDNTPPAVSFIGTIFRIEAPPKHCIPTFPCTGCFTRLFLTVDKIHTVHRISLKTSTRTGIPTSQRRPGGNNFFAAITPTSPCRKTNATGSEYSACSLKGHETGEPLARNILAIR